MVHVVIKQQCIKNKLKPLDSEEVCWEQLSLTSNVSHLYSYSEYCIGFQLAG